MDELLSLLDEFSKRKLATISGVRASAPIANTLLTQVLARPSTPERLLTNLALDVLKRIPERLNEEEVLRYLKANQTELPQDVLNLPKPYKEKLLTSAFEQAKTQQLNALKPILFDENTLSEIASELNIPIEIIKDIAQKSPENLFEALSRLRLKKETAKRTKEMLTSVPMEIVSRYADLFGVSADDLKPILDDPELGRKLIEQAIRLESSLALENKKQLNREQTIEKRSSARLLEKAEENFNASQAILEMSLSPTHQKLIQETPYKFLKIPEGDIASLASKVNIDGKPLIDLIRESRQKISERKYSYNDVVRLAAFEVFSSLVSQDPAKRIGISDLYDKINATIEKLKKGLTSKENLSENDYASISRDIINEMSKMYASSVGSLAPADFVAYMRSVIGDETDSIAGMISDLVMSSNFAKVQNAFNAMKGAISNVEFNTLINMAKAAPNSTSGLFASLLYGLYLSEKSYKRSKEILEKAEERTYGR